MSQERDVRDWKIVNCEAATAGNNTIVAGASGTRILLKHVILSVADATTIYFTNTSGTQMSNKFYFLPSGTFVLDQQLNILFGDNQSIIMVSSAAVNISLMVDIQKLS